MNRKDFGRLIAALRKEHFDPVAGKVWSQKVLAQKTNLSSKIIVNLEQGVKVNLDETTLIQLADAFSLTPLERQAFFAAANSVNDSAIVLPTQKPDAVRRELLDLLQQMQLPALLHDAFYDIIGINALATRFHHIDGAALAASARQGDSANVLALIFAPQSPFRSTMPQVWSNLAVSNVHQFRMMSLRYRHTSYFRQLFATLCRYPTFQRLWTDTQQQPHAFYSQLKTYTYDHPEFHQVHYTVTQNITLTNAGQLYLTVLVPNSSGTADCFTRLAQQIERKVYALAEWPKALTPSEIDGQPEAEDALLAQLSAGYGAQTGTDEQAGGVRAGVIGDAAHSSH